MIYNYASFLNEKDINIKQKVQEFIALYEYKEVNKFGTNGLVLNEFINRGNELILSDGPTTVQIKFNYRYDRLEISVNHTVKAMTEIFCNENRLIRMVGDILKQNNLELISFDLGTDGVIRP